MPNAGEQHGNHQIELGASEAFFAAAQRDIDIVANPSGQADVPSVPEVADVDGAKRRGKVFRQLEAEQHGQADDQIRVAGKVEKELEGIAINRRQHAPAVELGRIFKNRRYPAFRQYAGKPPLFWQCPTQSGRPPTPGKSVGVPVWCGFAPMRLLVRRLYF